MPQSPRPRPVGDAASRPPQLADRLLEWFCAPHLLEEVQGDLHERFHRRAALFGQPIARRQYVWEVLGFITKPFARKRQPSSYPNPTNMAMLQNYFKIASRNLMKHKVSTLINVLGLTLGITACLVIYLITSFELSFDTFHPDKERIYRVVGQVSMGKSAETHRVGFIPRAAPNAIRSEVSGLETVAAFHNLHTHVIIPDSSKEGKRFEGGSLGNNQEQIVMVDPQYFDIFRYEWLAGNPKTALNEPFKVVLSEQKARTYFGDVPIDNMLGREEIYRDSIRTTVSGIVKDWTYNTDFTFTDFISAATIRTSFLKGEINLDEWNDVGSASQTFVKLANNTTAAEVDARLATFGKTHFGPNRGTGDFRFTPNLQPLSDLHFNQQYQDNYSRKAHLPSLYGMMGVAVFILLIAAINFINLATAQSVQRIREVGMRKVLGGSRQSLIAQFIIETLILTVLAVVIALLLTKPVLTAYNSFIPKGVSFSVFKPQILVFLLVITLVTALLSGLYPSWILSGYRPAQALKGQTGLMGNQKGYLRKGLIVFQFTVSLLFIIGTIMMGRQLSFIRNKDLGFSTDAIVLINTPQVDKSDVLAQKFRQLSGVDRVAKQWAAPMSEGYMVTKMTYRGARDIETEVSAKIGDANYVPLYQLRVVAGRNIIPTDTLRELIINQTYAKALGFKQPAKAIGKLLSFNGRDYPIAGVVADFHENSLHAPIRPTFLAYIPGMSKDIAVKLATRGKQVSDARITLAAIEDAWQSVYPDKAFTYTFLDDSIARLYESDRKGAQLVNTATAIAILISCMGLFGLATFTAEQRTKEIGVRKVLGASVASIIALLSTDFVKLVFIALLIASPIAWWLTSKWLEEFAYRVDVAWWVFVLAGVLAMGIALLTVSFQSVRTALMNPVKSLRSE